MLSQAVIALLLALNVQSEALMKHSVRIPWRNFEHTEGETDVVGADCSDGSKRTCKAPLVCNDDDVCAAGTENEDNSGLLGFLRSIFGNGSILNSGTPRR